MNSSQGSKGRRIVSQGRIGLRLVSVLPIILKWEGTSGSLASSSNQ